MTQAEICTVLESSGVPVAKGPHALPYIVFLVPKDTPLSSDWETVADWHLVRAELYSRKADPDLESRVKAALDGAGVIYTAERVPLPEERMHMTVFEFEEIEVRP